MEELGPKLILAQDGHPGSFLQPWCCCGVPLHRGLQWVRSSAQRQPQALNLTRSKNVDLHIWRLHASRCGGCHGAWQPVQRDLFWLSVTGSTGLLTTSKAACHQPSHSAIRSNKQKQTQQTDWMASESKSPIPDESAPSSPAPSLSTASPGNSTRKLRGRAANIYDAVAGLLPSLLATRHLAPGLTFARTYHSQWCSRRLGNCRRQKQTPLELGGWSVLVTRCQTRPRRGPLQAQECSRAVRRARHLLGQRGPPGCRSPSSPRRKPAKVGS